MFLTGLKENLTMVKQRIEFACAKTGRAPGEITLVAVSKGRTLGQIKEAIAGGINDIGENRVQETLPQYNALRIAQNAPRIRWHMVGHLQTNKAKEAVRIFDLIQSVDSPGIAREINKQAQRLGKIQDVLIEVKTSDEATKFGLKADEVIEVIEQIAKFKNINIKGLMTIAPAVDNPGKTRPYFRKLRELRDKISDLRFAICDLRILSMGMSDDFEIAIEEGSNMLRLGRAIFGG